MKTNPIHLLRRGYWTWIQQLVLLAVLLLCAQAASAAGLRPTRLCCEHLENPLGIDTLQPRLSWVLDSPERGQKQTAWHILVAGTEANLKAGRGDLWDSGKVTSDQTTFIVYGGKPLASRQPCFWKVRVWDQDGQPSGWSDAADWEMGLLNPADWQARWIARTTDIEDKPAPMFRREFAVEGRIRKARAYICGLGYHELRINGRKIGDHLLDPGYTRYDKRVLYVTHDVTSMLQRGDNAIGVLLGHGWFNVQTKAVWDFHKSPWREAPKLLLSLVIEYADGRTVVIGSDASWKTSTGPIIFNSIYGGENYDARLEKPGWDRPRYDDSSWQPAQLVSAPKGRLVAQMMPPIKADHVIKPVKITEPKPGVFIFDLGQSLAGFVELKVRGPAGTKVALRHGERLFPDGNLDMRDIEQHVKKLDPNQQFQTDSYILRGGGTETWHSRFTYHGFQYVEVTGFPGKPTLDNLRGVFIHSALPITGNFECSNPMLNQIVRAARWAYLSNLQGIPTDCPHREKNGWTGDAHLACEQGLFNYDGAAVYTKWINDLGDEQQPTGELPGIVPTSGWGYKWGNGPAWDSAFVLIPYYLYEYCGDAQPLRDHYAGMRRYVDYLTSKAKNGIVDIGLNDWAPFETKTPADITSTAYYYRDTRILSLAASLLGKHDEAREYAALAENIKTAFNRKFYQVDTGLYGNGSQTSLSCALYQELAAPENRDRVLQNLVANIEKRNGHLDTGILGAKYLLHALTDGGRADVAYRIVSQKDLPSWGWWLEQGASTLWEQWNGSESRNHIMFGDVVAWFYRTLAGINPDPAAPGFKHILIRPHPVGDLTFSRAEYDSVRGKIVSDWKIQQGQFRLRVVIPPNTTATVFVPGAGVSDVREGRGPATKARGVISFRDENGRAVFQIDSGEYEFTARRAP